MRAKRKPLIAYFDVLPYPFRIACIVATFLAVFPVAFIFEAFRLTAIFMLDCGEWVLSRVTGESSTIVDWWVDLKLALRRATKEVL